eukprot:scaffold22360_cov33-Attheya_sp.AAC.1
MESETIGFATTLHFQWCDTESQHWVSVEPQKVSPHVFSGQEVSHGLYWKALEVERETTKHNANKCGTDFRVLGGKVGICVASDTHWPRHGGGGKKYVSPSCLT